MYIKKDFGYWTAQGRNVEQIQFFRYLNEILTKGGFNTQVHGEDDICIIGNNIEQKHFLDTLFQILIKMNQEIARNRLFESV